MTIYELNPNQMRLPLGGKHIFLDRSSFMTFTDDTFDGLIEKIESHRVNNGMDVGNPKEEVIESYAKNYPWMVRLKTEAVGPDEINKRYEMTKMWLRHVWGHPPGGQEPTRVSEERWDICRKCLHNQRFQWPDTAEADEWEKRRFLLVKGLKIPQEIGFCALHRWDNGVASVLETPIRFSAKTKDSGQPGWCWSESMKGSARAS